ncbi:MAG: hypothetical protein IK144_08610 [Bacteroidaceae bacterium]|nr:hypothetical protein [Bacteroidaceae bacterium]
MPVNSILGKKAIMNCGMQAEVIEDNGYNDITVCFTDGYISHRRSRQQFNSGSINNPNVNRTSIIGRKMTMNCGMEAEVIEDFGSKNITVRFPDGYTSYHRERIAFLRGEISNPNCRKISLIGRKKMMNCGMEAEVIEDFSYKNITVQFTDGTILENKRRDAFLSGKIKNPNYDGNNIKGTVSMMNCGMEAEVIEDYGDENITVKFSDGTIKKHCSRHNFLKGKIRNPNLANNHSLPQALVYYFVHKYFPDTVSNYRPDWLRNRMTMTNLEIDIWIPSKEIGIEYDGYRSHCKETQNSLEKVELITSASEIKKIITILERGAVIHSSPKHINYQLDYVSDYNEYLSLLKQLEDTINIILKYLGVYETIIIDNDLINNLYYKIDPAEYRKFIVDNSAGKGKKRILCSIIGKKAMMNCGMEAEVIEDNGFRDITVKFADGYVAYNRTRHEFKTGHINNPNVIRGSLIGQSKVMKNGMQAMVIEDKGAYNVIIKFEDGYIARCSRSHFKSGQVKNPNINFGSILGDKAIMNCGMEAEVIEDNGCRNITVRFTDGYISYKRTRQEFKERGINNPNINRTSFLGRKLIMKCGMEAEVIEDNGSRDITVKFADGYTTYHRERGAFVRKTISNPNSRIISLVGKRQMMCCGMVAEVIEDWGYKNITVKFTDGTILKNRRRDSFLLGHIKNPNYDGGSLKGKIAIMNCGIEAEVIEDFGNENITVRFIDGTIRKKCTRHNFLKGKIGNKQNDGIIKR